MIMDGGTSRRALTTAMLDLASRGLIAFREEPGVLLAGKKVGIDVAPAAGRRRRSRRSAPRNARRPTGPAEEVALRDLRGAGRRRGRRLHHARRPAQVRLRTSPTSTRRSRSTSSAAAGSARSRARSSRAGPAAAVLAIVGGVIALIAGLNIPFSGLTLIGVAAIAGGIVVIVFARAMPAVTMPGAMIRAMLAAYRRTLQKTMAQARSMEQVVDEAGLDWLDTPDQAVVWGTALGLQGEIEGVLSRSLEDVQEGRTAAAPCPTSRPGTRPRAARRSWAAADAAGSGGSIFSDSGIPDLGGMMSALGTIGNSPSSSGGGGGGGFSGGSSGGGGGGAGGGF